MCVQCKDCMNAYAQDYMKRNGVKDRKAESVRRLRKNASAEQKKKSLDRLKCWKENNKEKVNKYVGDKIVRNIIRHKNHVQTISDAYVVYCLRIPVELAPLKRAQLKIKRAVKQQKQIIKDISNAK